jgi:F-type H+-transporting ATPase subunit a
MEEVEATHGEHHGSHDPMEHVRDEPIFGLDSITGKVVYKPLEHHNYQATVLHLGPVPFKVEFSKHMASFTFAAGLIFIVCLVMARKVIHGLHAGKAPEGKLANAVEAAVVFVRDELVEPTGGHHLAHYTPLFILYFLLILVCNLMGMIPDVGHLWGTATGNFSITAGLALTVYALIWILGIYNQGFFHFLKNLVPHGVPIFLWPVIFILELAGPIIKCFVLAVRLFANMIAGHLILSQLLALGGVLMLLGFPLALGISILEVLVCILQAYVFTLLAVGFIGAAVHPDH